MDTHNLDNLANKNKFLRVAWLVPSANAGAHWEPVWSGFLEEYIYSRFYTTDVWKEFDHSSLYAKAVYQLGNIKSVLADKSGSGYNHGFLVLPLNVIFYLVKFRPQVIISNAFSVWSFIAILFKQLFNWKVIILYEGSTPSSDFRDSRLRTFVRKTISNSTDVFISNSISAKKYLIDFLGVEDGLIVPGPYLLPNKVSMLSKVNKVSFDVEDHKKPLFLFIGQIIKRKGIFELISACILLRKQGIEDYSLLILGEGLEKDNIQQMIKENNLDKQISIVGRVNYDQLGIFYEECTALVFPTFEDTWGMVVLEAMTFGKPVLCSKYAGSSEMIEDTKTGFIIDPNCPVDIAERMLSFIMNLKMAKEMGEYARKSIEIYTVDYSTQVFSTAISKSLNDFSD